MGDEPQIKETEDIADFLQICLKLQKVKIRPIERKSFLRYLLSTNNDLVKKIVCYEEPLTPEHIPILVGCAVFTGVATYDSKIAWVDFMWADSHRLEMCGRLIQYINDVAKTYGYTKIQMQTSHGFKAWEKKYKGKEVYRVYEREVE